MSEGSMSDFETQFKYLKDANLRDY